VALGVVRLGCFLGGCCYGVVCDRPWAVRFPQHIGPWFDHVAAGWIPRTAPHSLPVHPLQFYFAAVSLAIGLFLPRAEHRKAYGGEVMAAYLFLHGTTHFFLECLRAEPAPFVQPVTGLFALAGAALLVAGRLPARRRRA
jgi:phosphatidylglycerol:prolipoprotein diacylglycerol transferase